MKWVVAGFTLITIFILMVAFSPVGIAIMWWGREMIHWLRYGIVFGLVTLVLFVMYRLTK